MARSDGSSTVKLAIRVKQKLLSYKSIFYACWTLFTKVYPRYDTAYYLAEVEKMLNCGTDLGGFALFGCCRCGKGRHKIFFSCKSNACLKCVKRYGREAMERITSKLFLGISYRQVVLTLPEQLRGPFYNHSNKDKLYSNFMRLKVLHLNFSQQCLLVLFQKVESLLHFLTLKNTFYFQSLESLKSIHFHFFYQK